MKWWKKLLLGAAVVLLLLQLPGIYGRYTLYSLSTKIQASGKKHAGNTGKGYKDYSGVIHIHSFLGEHSTGTFEDLIRAARANRLDYVVMTEHVSGYFDTADKTLNDVHGGVLFVGGNEAVSGDGDRFLVVPGFAELGSEKFSSRELINQAHERRSLVLQPYPEKNPLPAMPIEGVEVFSLNTNSKNMNIPWFILEAIWSYGSYPELLLARHLRRPETGLERFDQMAAEYRTTLFGGTDAHSNIGVHIGDDTNKRFINLKFDEYESIFRLVRNHVLIEESTEFGNESLLEAIREGRAYTSFDILGDGTGFYFGALDGTSKTVMGGETELTEGTRLEALAPLAGRFVVFRNGKKHFESGITNRIDIGVEKTGVYRTEVYRDDLGSPFDDTPWIISNAVYIRAPKKPDPDGSENDQQRSASSNRKPS